jgi:hypothetical protein
MQIATVKLKEIILPGVRGVLNQRAMNIFGNIGALE